MVNINDLVKTVLEEGGFPAHVMRLLPSTILVYPLTLQGRAAAIRDINDILHRVKDFNYLDVGNHKGDVDFLEKVISKIAGHKG